MNRITLLTFRQTLLILVTALLSGHGFVAHAQANGQPFEELQAQIDDLSARLNALENSETVFLTVDCNLGESIQAAIDSVPAISPVDIEIDGTCNESIVIVRDDVTLHGVSPSDGFNGSLSVIFGASRIFLNDMSISSNLLYTFGCFQGSAVTGRNLDISGGLIGVLAIDGGQCKLSESTIHNATFGVRIAKDSLGDLEGVTVTDNITGIYAEQGGDITVQSSAATFGGTKRSLITQNNVGIQIRSGGTVDVAQSDVTYNMDDGIKAELGSTVKIAQDTSVNSNGGDGVELSGLSTLMFFPPATIGNNSGWGITCSGTTASLIVGNVTGNGDGNVDTNCQ